MKEKIISQDFSKNFYSKRKKEKEKFNFWVNSTYLSLLSIITILLLHYVWILNINATQWYNIIQLNLEKSDLMKEKEKLDLKIAEIQSLSEIMSEENKQNMEKVTDPDFLVIKNDIQYVYNEKQFLKNYFFYFKIPNLFLFFIVFLRFYLSL